MTKFRFAALALAAWVAIGSAAHAQGPPTPPPFSSLGSYSSLSVTNSSAATALPAAVGTFGAVTLYNSGSVDAYFAFGSASVVATTSPSGVGAGKVPAGTFLTVFATGPYIAVVTASSTTTVQVFQATGPIQFGLVGGGSSGPTGPAGGDLAGTYPNPTLAWISRAASQTLNIGAGGTLTALAFTAPGTGVATALGVNIGSAGALVLFNGAGGTPSSLVGTNITGTASGLTAGNVTTNANLTGQVTSVGNATTIATTQPDAHTWQALQTHSGAGVAYSGAISSAAWTTTGLLRQHTAATLTDTSSSGTVAAAYTNAFGGNTIAASSATTYTRYVGANFTTPTAGTNVTMTSAIALAADNISIGGAALAGNALAVTGTSLLNGLAYFSSAGLEVSTLGAGLSTRHAVLSNGLYQFNGGALYFSSSATDVVPITSTFSQASSGVLQIGTTTTNALGSLNLTNLTATGVVNTPVGSVSANSVQVGAINTGLYSRFGTVLTIATAGAAIVEIGNLGAGTGVTLSNTEPLSWASSGISGAPNLFLSHPAAATLQLGAADVASGAVAQTLQVQSNTGTTTTGPDFTIIGSGGTTAGGSIIFKTKATTTAAAALTLAPNGNATFVGTTVFGAIQIANGTGSMSVSSTTLNIGSSGSNVTLIGADTGKLSFGGTSSSFPALKRSTTTLAVRLADDSADAGISASTGAFSGAVSLGNTVNSVSPTSPNRTVTMVIGGTTYYLAAKTTND